jgi:hypothetical protein
MCVREVVESVVDSDSVKRQAMEKKLERYRRRSGGMLRLWPSSPPRRVWQTMRKFVEKEDAYRSPDILYEQLGKGCVDHRHPRVHINCILTPSKSSAYTFARNFFRVLGFDARRVSLAPNTHARRFGCDHAWDVYKEFNTHREAEMFVSAVHGQRIQSDGVRVFVLRAGSQKTARGAVETPSTARVVFRNCPASSHHKQWELLCSTVGTETIKHAALDPAHGTLAVEFTDHLHAARTVERLSGKIVALGAAPVEASPLPARAGPCSPVRRVMHSAEEHTAVLIHNFRANERPSIWSYITGHLDMNSILAVRITRSKPRITHQYRVALQFKTASAAKHFVFTHSDAPAAPDHPLKMTLHQPRSVLPALTV